MNEIENKLVNDFHWRELEKQPKEFGECAGCEEPIVEGEGYYEIHVLGDTVMVHQHMACCRQFLGEIAICRTAGE